MATARRRPRHLLGNDLVREARKRAGLTQRELAERAGTTQSAVARLESGRTSPAFETVVALVRTCGFDVEVHLVEPDLATFAQAQHNLRLTPEGRLDQLESTADFVAAGREALKEARRG